MSRMAILAALMFVALAGPARAQEAPIVWKALLVAGDDSIPAFDNAVRTLAGKLQWRGVAAVRTLTSRRGIRQADAVATAVNVDNALASLRIGLGEGCLLFLTSHGTEAGLDFVRDAVNNRRLYPEDLARSLDAHCAEAPTVVVVSGCHAGTFIREAVVRPNRIILTAARRDRPSFGCDFKRRYTYFDGCLIENFDASADWRQVFDRTIACIGALEAEANLQPSEPQADFGVAVAGAKLPGVR
jgi:hypothetical protein